MKIKVGELLLLNYTALGISIADIEQYLQIAILIFSGIVSIVASIQKLKSNKKKE